MQRQHVRNGHSAQTDTLTMSVMLGGHGNSHSWGRVVEEWKKSPYANIISHTHSLNTKRAHTDGIEYFLTFSKRCCSGDLYSIVPVGMC